MSGQSWEEIAEQAGLSFVQSETHPDLGWFALGEGSLWGPFESREAAFKGTFQNLVKGWESGRADPINEALPKSSAVEVDDEDMGPIRYLYVSSLQEEDSAPVFTAWVSVDEQLHLEGEEYTNPNLAEPPDISEVQDNLDHISSALKSLARDAVEPPLTLRTHQAEIVAWLRGQATAPDDLRGQVEVLRNMLDDLHMDVEQITPEQNFALKVCRLCAEEAKAGKQEYYQELLSDMDDVLDWIDEWQVMAFSIDEVLDNLDEELHLMTAEQANTAEGAVANMEQPLSDLREQVVSLKEILEEDMID